MNQTRAIALLKANQNKVNIEKWKKSKNGATGLRSYGIGLTILRKLAKQIGRDHTLALKLFESDIYDARIIALLIDDPKKISREQAEKQVEQVGQGHLAHVFSSCDASLAKTSFVVELLLDWTKSKDTVRRRCGYGLLYEVSKSKRSDAPGDAFFLDRIGYIKRTFKGEDNLVLASMGGALLGIGKRNAVLNKAALKVAREIGPIQFDAGGKNCEPFDVARHLTSDYVKKKLGIK